MNKAVLIKSDDWEGLYINDVLVEEGHTLNQGFNRIEYFVDASEQYDFDIKELQEYWVTDEYEEYLYEIGSLNENLSDVDYDKTTEARTLKRVGEDKKALRCGNPIICNSYK